MPTVRAASALWSLSIASSLLLFSACTHKYVKPRSEVIQEALTSGLSIRTPEQDAQLILPWQALHAGRLWLPWQGREVEFSSPPEPWFAEFAEGFPGRDPVNPGPDGTGPR